MTDEQRAWLSAHRCPWCRSRRQCGKDYAVDRAHVGWRCRGYRCDEERRFGR